MSERAREKRGCAPHADHPEVVYNVLIDDLSNTLVLCTRKTEIGLNRYVLLGTGAPNPREKAVKFEGGRPFPLWHPRHQNNIVASMSQADKDENAWWTAKNKRMNSYPKHPTELEPQPIMEGSTDIEVIEARPW